MSRLVQDRVSVSRPIEGALCGMRLPEMRSCRRLLSPGRHGRVMRWSEDDRAAGRMTKRRSVMGELERTFRLHLGRINHNRLIVALDSAERMPGIRRGRRCVEMRWGIASDLGLCRMLLVATTARARMGKKRRRRRDPTLLRCRRSPTRTLQRLRIGRALLLPLVSPQSVVLRVERFQGRGLVRIALGAV
jgi:hypothetical protein